MAIENPQISRSQGDGGGSASDPAAATGSGKWTDQLAKAATILGAFFAVGQTGSQMIHSHYQSQMELEKAKQNLLLDKQKSDSALASEFLKFIMEKEADDRKRSLLFDALSNVPSHPLQGWAKTQHTEYEKRLAALERAREAQLSAPDEKSEADRKVRSLEFEIQTLSARIQIYREDPEKTEPLYVQRQKLREQLAFAKGSYSVAEKKAALAASPETVLDAAAVISFRLPIDPIRTVLKFPKGPALFDKYMPFVESGLAEFQLTDKKMVAAIIATAAHETNSFSIVTEFGSGAMYENRKDLGNTQPGDGERYKGRGLVQIVGRTNYAHYSERLGLGTLLIDSPQDANAPDVAARVLCAYFKDKEARFMAALLNSDLRGVRKLVNGGLAGFENFSKIYTDVLAVL